MEDLNGIEVSKLLRSVNKDVLIIFVSTTREYVFDTFAVHPFEYLLKPYTYERFSKMFDEVVYHYTDNKKKISLKVPYMELSVATCDIVAVVSNLHSVEFRMTNEKVIKSIMPFKDVKLLLDEPCFIEINCGIIINMDYSLSIKDDKMNMKDGTSYHLKIRNRNKIKSQFTCYMVTKIRGIDT